MTALQVIGGGRMGTALLGGLAGGWAPIGQLAVVEPDTSNRSALAEFLPGIQIRTEPLEGVDAVIAVKPHLVTEVLGGLRGVERILSIAAGITTAAMEAACPDARVVRSMPNTPSLVGLGASAVAGGVTATPDDLDWASGILRAVGAVEVVTEAMLDAVTGLSGSGPAYIFLIAEAMIDGGVAAGLPRNVATTLAIQTLRGAGEMLTGDASPSELRAGVVTPAGTTAAGLGILEQRAVRSAVIDAIAAARDRSVELGAD